MAYAQMRPTTRQERNAVRRRNASGMAFLGAGLGAIDGAYEAGRKFRGKGALIGAGIGTALGAGAGAVMATPKKTFEKPPTGIKVSKARENMSTKSPFGVDHNDISKALTGTTGDKRNTKYAAGTLGAAYVGNRVGSFKAAGGLKNYKSLSRNGVSAAATAGMNAGSPERGAVAGAKAMRASLGPKVIRGGRIGMLTGGALGAGAVAMGRRNNVAKSAFGIEH